ncbi:glutathione-dependent formaldehyde-activating GFA [Coniochaeta sp. PMI_546]|nr:glutathione-dependent formaldehyde-activating GFA [Coniochaeta sp. PMI_546]
MMSTSTPENFPKPKEITGGCLCGSLRYKIVFPDDHDFLKSSGSCQCTQCRRQTGALIFYSHTILLENLTWLTPTDDALNKFVATPGYERGVCRNCGSLLYWRDVRRPDLEIAVGSVDPEYLVGDAEGKEPGYGFALANCCSHNVFCSNEIKGVTDGLPGKGRGIRWATSSEDGVRMP